MSEESVPWMTMEVFVDVTLGHKYNTYCCEILMSIEYQQKGEG